jgi:uncharacterized repeat protein (TIGR01451 family)
MLRRWTLTALCVGTICLSVSGARVATAGPSLAERFSFLTGGSAAKPKPQPIRDEHVQPAAAAGPANRPRAAKDAAMSGTTRRSTGGGGGLFGGLHLPTFGSQGPSNEEISNPPLPYDPAEVRSQGGQQAARGTASAAPRRQGAATGGTAATRPTGTTAGRPTGTATARTTGTTSRRTVGTASSPASPPPSSRVARTSPHADGRHNELADALAGLRGRDDAASESTPDESDVAPPEAVADEESLSDAQAPARDASDTNISARGPMDVADALNNVAASAAAVEPETPVATAAPAPRPRAGAAAPTVQRPTSAAPTTTVRRTPGSAPIAENDVAAVLQDESVIASAPVAPRAVPQPVAAPIEQEEEYLGGISAESAPRTFRSAAAPTSAPVTSTIVRSTAPDRTASSSMTARTPSIPARAGNLRQRTDMRTDATRSDVLLSARQPVIVSSVAGPARIVVGRTAEYRVSLENKGDDAAHELVATIAVPAWADVVDAVGSNGSVDRVAAASQDAANTVRWQLYELAPGAAQTLTLKLIPRSGRPLQLDVQWNHAAVTGSTTVQVEEPKLQMEISGPGEVLYGKSQRYTLTLSNPGTGDAEEVSIELTPPGGDPKAPVKHKIGVLKAGSTKSIELELTAREGGDLKMYAAAIAAGDLRTEATKTVLCRKAALDVDWRGPDKNFSGAVATYYLRVRNPGTAPADQVEVGLNLPVGAELVDASAGNAWDAAKRVVSWKPGSLAAGEERFLQFRCKLSQPGVNQMELVAQTAAGDLSDVQSMPVTIEALADLKLTVSDPEGIIPVGDAVVYEIKVENRGQTAAHGVNVVGMFSEGIDPVQVEGGQHEIRDGRVTFRTADALAAGGEMTLKIHAKATSAGTHVFRAEVVCDDLETKLASEETTRFFVEEDRWADASAAYSEGGEGTTR